MNRAHGVLARRILAGWRCRPLFWDISSLAPTRRAPFVSAIIGVFILLGLFGPNMSVARRASALPSALHPDQCVVFESDFSGPSWSLAAIESSPNGVSRHMDDRCQCRARPHDDAACRHSVLSRLERSAGVNWPRRYVSCAVGMLWAAATLLDVYVIVLAVGGLATPRIAISSDMGAFTDGHCHGRPTSGAATCEWLIPHARRVSCANANAALPVCGLC